MHFIILFGLVFIHNHVTTSWKDDFQTQVIISWSLNEIRDSILWKTISWSTTLKNFWEFLPHLRRVWRETLTIVSIYRCSYRWLCNSICQRLFICIYHDRISSHLCFRHNLRWRYNEEASNRKNYDECETWQVHWRIDECNQTCDSFWKRRVCLRIIRENCKRNLSCQ